MCIVYTHAFMYTHIYTRMYMYGCMCSCMLGHFSCAWLFATLWTVTCQASLSVGFSSKDTAVCCPVLLQGIFRAHASTCISCGSCIASRFFTTEPLRKPHWPYIESMCGLAILLHFGILFIFNFFLICKPKPHCLDFFSFLVAHEIKECKSHLLFFSKLFGKTINFNKKL